MKINFFDQMSQPLFGLERRDSIAKLLAFLLTAAIVANGLYIVGRLINGENFLGASIIINFILLLLHAFLLFAIKWGYVKNAAVFTVFTTWAAMTYQAWNADGVRDTAVTIYILIVMISALITSWRVSLVVSLLSIVAIWGMAIGEVAGVRSPKFDSPYKTAWELTAIYLMLIALVYLVVSTIRQALTAVREGDEGFKKVFQISPVAINVTTLKDGILVDANDAYWKLTGFDPATSLGKTTVELTIWDKDSDRQKISQELITKKSLQNPNYEFINENGDKKVTAAFSELIDSGGEPTVLSMFYDITEQVVAREELTASEEKYRNFVETSIEGIYFLEFDEPISIHLPQEEQAERIYTMSSIVECNETLALMYGYRSSDEVRGMRLLEVIGGELNEVNIRAAEQLVRSGYRASNLEIEEKTVDGHTKHFLSNEVCVIDDEHIVGLWGTQLDVTDLRRAQDALERSEARMRALLDAIPDMIFEFNGQGDILQFIPSSTIQPFLTPEEFLGKNISQFMPPDVVEQTMFASQRALESGLLQVFEYQLPEDNKQNYYEASVIRNDVNSVLAMIRDVTARKWAATERENLIDELEKKNAELEQFTYTVSHDLKSPLITIRGFLGYIREDVEKGNKERLETDMQRISDATEKMQKLLGDLLDLSRVGRLVNDSEDADMNELVIETVELLHGRITQNNIQMQVSDNLPILRVDRQRIVEVLQNLIDNAANFLGDQTAPTITIGQEGVLNGMPVIFVKDNGVGISPEFKDRIFGLFNKLDSRSDGTGIGLALVKRIIEFHGGRIWLESELGSGTTFFFTLPAQPMPDV